MQTVHARTAHHRHHPPRHARQRMAATAVVPTQMTAGPRRGSTIFAARSPHETAVPMHRARTTRMPTRAVQRRGKASRGMQINATSSRQKSAGRVTYASTVKPIRRVARAQRQRPQPLLTVLLPQPHQPQRSRTCRQLGGASTRIRSRQSTAGQMHRPRTVAVQSG